jgi:methylase of polypeptide subunit release factors
MNQNILNYLRKYSYNIWDVNRLLVSSFLVANNLGNITNEFIRQYIIPLSNQEEHIKLEEFIQLLNDTAFEIEHLLELFEFVISPADKEVNGAVFTPKYIREYIVNQTIQKYIEQGGDVSKGRYGDIACGCGGFFITLVDLIKEHINKPYAEIYAENIFGVDIQNYSIERTQILLTLHAIINGEDELAFTFNLYQGNSLNFDWQIVSEIRENEGFDIIVGNPPYVGSSKIDSDTKLLLKNWSVASSGKSDLYIPFFEIGMENLSSSGILGYITVNTFYKSLNGRSVRSYFSKNNFDITIIDFGGEQLFRKRSTYTCICIIAKESTGKVRYIKSKSTDINSIKKKDYIVLPYKTLNDQDGWYLIDKKTKEIIDKIENTGKPLGMRFEIRNGFATLKNNIYVFKPVKENKNYYFLTKDGVEYQVEKGICRNAIKPNTLKVEAEIFDSMEKLIFPYLITSENTDLFDGTKSALKIMDEDFLQSNHPYTYQYLLSQKQILSERDKGNRDYEKWYAYGRNQALTLSGYKLLLPYITNTPCFVYSDDKELLFYNGYAILSNSDEELLVLQKILMSKVFWFYIKNTSKPYSGNYFSVAKNYIKNFGICDLSEDEKNVLLNMPEGEALDKFLIQKYNIESL